MAAKESSSVDRRNFLRVVGGGSAAATAAVAAPMVATEAQAYNPGAEEAKGRYRQDAPDVQAFYRTNGYETLKK